jgi:hypothetical protein
MKKYFITSLVVFILFQNGYTQQDATAVGYGNTIRVSDLKDNLSILASDALEGRNTGSRGQKMAAAFISNHFQQLGLKPPVNGSYYQPVELYSLHHNEVFLKAGIRVLKIIKRSFTSAPLIAVARNSLM